MKINILNIIPGTSVDGPGLRTSIYMSGCNHHCKGCHNPQSWNPTAGKDMTIDEIIKFINNEQFDITLTGGDPLFNPQKTLALVKAIKANDYNIWMYTGYRWEDIVCDSERRLILNYIDVVVDGQFDESQRDISLLFRGSANQRIIDVAKSIEQNKLILWQRDSI